jgi:hypothetical protein
MNPVSINIMVKEQPMTKFAFNFTPAPEPKRLKLSLPADLCDWYEREALSHGGTMEAGIVQALQFVRRCQDEPEATPRTRNRKKASQTPSLRPGV